MSDTSLNRLESKLDTLHEDHAKLSERVSLLERDIQGNGVPGMKTIVQNMNDKLDAVLLWIKEWSMGADARERTCFYTKSVKENEKKQTNWIKWIGIGIIAATFLFFTIPGAIDQWKHLFGGGH